MIVLYVLPGCGSCARTIEELKRKEVWFRVFPVKSQTEADLLLSEFPQMACDTCAYGLSLPFAAEGTSLIGGHDDLVRHLHR